MHVVLVCDIDNTIYDFIDFYGRAFRAMVHALGKTMNQDENSMIEEFRMLFAHAGTLDFRNLIRNLDSVQRLTFAERERLLSIGRQAYDRSRRKSLTAYPELNYVLEAATRAGVQVVGFTNAPFDHAYTRLQMVDSLRYFSGLVAWEGVQLPDGDPLYDAKVHQREAERVAAARQRLRLTALLPKTQAKPNMAGFEMIRQHFGNATYFMLGDSLQTDLFPAHQIGMSTIWAKYGTAIDHKNLETVLQITPWRSFEIERHGDRSFVPDHIVEHPRELLGILPHVAQIDLPLSYA